MARILRADAVCLCRSRYRETSKLVTFFTREFGKIVLVARGARRPKSRFGAALEPGVRSRIIFYRREHRRINTLTDTEIVAESGSLRLEPARFRAASVMLEFANRFLQPDDPAPALFRLLTSGLEVLGSDIAEPVAVVYAYLLKGAAILGYSPQLDCCLSCRHRRAAAFSPRLGGFLCSRCVSRSSDAIPVTALSVRQLRSLYHMPLRRNAGTRLLSDVRLLVRQHLRYHFDGFELRSLRRLPGAVAGVPGDTEDYDNPS